MGISTRRIIVCGASKNLNTFVEKGLHPQNPGMWYAVSRMRVVGPFFFKETINAHQYQAIGIQFIASLNPDEQYC